MGMLLVPDPGVARKDRTPDDLPSPLCATSHYVGESDHRCSASRFHYLLCGPYFPELAICFYPFPPRANSSVNINNTGKGSYNSTLNHSHIKSIPSIKLPRIIITSLISTMAPFGTIYSYMPSPRVAKVRATFYRALMKPTTNIFRNSHRPRRQPTLMASSWQSSPTSSSEKPTAPRSFSPSSPLARCPPSREPTV